MSNCTSLHVRHVHFIRHTLLTESRRFHHSTPNTLPGSTIIKMASNSVDIINQKISNVLQKPQITPEELEDNLGCAAKAFKAKSYMIAGKYFNNFLDANNRDGECLTTNPETIVVVTYLSCLCSIESSNSKNLWDALEILEKLVKHHISKYPMLYYAVGKAYFKLYRFNKAAEIIKKCFALFRNEKTVFQTYYIPESEEIISESTRKGLLAAIHGLSQECSSWHRPNAVCCLSECLNFSFNEAGDKNIFFGSPTFVGMVQVTCNNPTNNCTMNFHVACWKAKKESLCSTGKISDKDVLHLECFTPNCVDDHGARSTIKKIEIFDDHASVKATIETRGDDTIKHVKSVPTPKGAIKKQQNQPKPKISNESRAPVVRNPKPPVVQKEIVKIETFEEEEDEFQNEQTLNAAVDKLGQLRAYNFGIRKDKIWRPNLSMYGNEFMLETSKSLPDPEFSKNCPSDEEKAFVFSYFFEFLSNNGPMELSRLEEKWQETQTEILGKPCESITIRHVDLAEFLTQSLKFAIVGEYICTADRLPEAYLAAKNDICETLKFFLETDVDQNSTASSLDDEAAYNDFINQKQNYSMFNSTITSDTQSFTNGETKSVSDASINGTQKYDNEYTNGVDERKNTVESKECLEVDTNTYYIDNITWPPKFVAKESSPSAETTEETVQMGSSAITDEFNSPVGKNAQKRSNSLESPRNLTCLETEKNNEAKIVKESSIERAYTSEGCNSPKDTINKGAYSVNDIKNHLKSSRTELKLNNSAKKTESTNDFQNRNTSIDNNLRKTPVESKVENETRSFPIDATTKETVEQSEVVPMKNNIDSESKDNADNSKFISEIQHLKEELAECKKERNKLKVDLAVMTQNFTIFIAQMATNLLNKQYETNRTAISAALNELNFEYKLIVDIQKILHSSIGDKLPINESEFMSKIAEVEKLAMNQQAKFMKVRDELSSNLIKRNYQAIDLQPEQIPNLPKRNLSDVLHSAFGMYRMHYLKELQCLQMPPGQSSFIGSHVAQIPPYGSPNVHNIPKNFNQSPQMNFMNLTNTQPLNLQHFGNPHLGSPLLATPYAYGQQQYTARPPPPVPAYLKNQPPPLKLVPTTSNHSKNPFTEKSELPSVSSTQATEKIKSESSELPKTAPLVRESNIEQQMTATSQEFKDLLEKSIVRGSTENIAVANRTPESLTTNENPLESPIKNSKSTIKNSTATNFESVQNHAEIIQRVETPTRVTPSVTRSHCLDKLMRRLRSCYTGVLELDLLKSIEYVRKQHNNSLSKLPIRRIISEADHFVGIIQQKQLCGYVKYQPNQYSAGRSTALQHQVDNERMSSRSSSPFVTPSKKESIVSSKKQWEPVHIPNDTWIKNVTENSDCAICIEVMSIDNIQTLECKHSFHRQCIRDWHKHQANSKSVISSCPLCRHHTAIDNEYPPLPLGLQNY